MFTVMVLVFVLGYTAIALEHPLRLDKAASALLIGVITWAAYILFSHEILNLGFNAEWVKGISHNPVHFVKEELEHHLVEISEILFQG